MVILHAALCRLRCKRSSSSAERGFLLVQLCFAIILCAVFACIIFAAAYRVTDSWTGILARMRLQSTARYMLSILEKRIAYNSARVIVTDDNKIICHTLTPYRTITFYPDKNGLYKQTSSREGVGINPVSLANVRVSGWHAVKASERSVLVDFTLHSSGKERTFSALFNIYNGAAADE